MTVSVTVKMRVTVTDSRGDIERDGEGKAVHERTRCRNVDLRLSKDMRNNLKLTCTGGSMHGFSMYGGFNARGVQNTG